MGKAKVKDFMPTEQVKGEFKGNSTEGLMNNGHESAIFDNKEECWGFVWGLLQNGYTVTMTSGSVGGWIQYKVYFSKK